MSRSCARCGRKLRNPNALIGPECAKIAQSEVDAFARKLGYESGYAFVYDCINDFASDEGLTAEEWVKKYGNPANDLNEQIEYLTNHGLWRIKRR